MIDDSTEATGIEKMPTGIEGFDELAGGGLPRERTTLVLGHSGTGKTVFALQFLRPGPTVILRLYLAPGAPNSVRALGNLQAICDEYLPGCYELELVDVRREPRRALADGILVTPALVRIAPLPQVKIVGNLSQRERVLHALGIPTGPNAGEEASHGRP